LRLTLAVIRDVRASNVGFSFSLLHHSLQKNKVTPYLTLSLLISYIYIYIYGAPSKARNLTSYIYGRPFAPCRRFSACKRSLNGVKRRHFSKITGPFSPTFQPFVTRSARVDGDFKASGGGSGNV
jgi:hypothetical protein